MAAGNLTLVPEQLKLECKPEVGLCLVAAKYFKVREIAFSERPLLFATGSLDCPSPEPQLCAFCKAPTVVQQAVLQMFSAPLDDLSPLVTDAHTAVEELLKRHQSTSDGKIPIDHWLHGVPFEVLHKALVVMQLNSHAFQHGLALFQWGSKLAHSCVPNTEYSGVHIPGHGSHFVIFPIYPRQCVTTNYLGDSRQSTVWRQGTLMKEKLFLCQCPRCVAPDWARAIPCPSCHIRDAAGLLPDEILQPPALSDIHYAVTIGDGAMWNCAYCGCERCMADILPAIGSWVLPESVAPSKTLTGGRDLEMALEEVIQQLGDRPRIEVPPWLEMVPRILGPQHWVSAQALALKCGSLAAAVAGMGPEYLHPTAAAEQLLAGLEGLWHICVRAFILPHHFGAVFLDGLLTVAECMPYYSLPVANCQHALVTVALLRRPLTDSLLPISQVADGADGLREAGLQALDHGNPREAALLLCGAALLGDQRADEGLTLTLPMVFPVVS